MCTKEGVSVTDTDDHSYEDVEHSMYGTDLEDDPDDWIPGVNRTDAEWCAWLTGTTEPAEPTEDEGVSR